LYGCVRRGVTRMSVILLVLGILVTAAGAALIGFGIPVNELSRGTTLILAGTTALVGGLILVGLAAVVAELVRVVATLKARQAARPVRAADVSAAAADAVAREIMPPVAEAPQPAPAASSPSLEVSSSAIERLRSNIPRPEKAVPEAEEVPLSPNGQQAHHPVEPRVELPSRAEPAPRSAGAAAVETREPRLDFLFRPRQARQAQPQEAFDALWPKRAGRDAQADPRVEVARVPAAAPVAAPAPAEAQEAVQPAPPPVVEPVDEPRPVAILKSGVVDGMAYTLYADGSIEAQLPQGTVRFGSIAELRAHIENNNA